MATSKNIRVTTSVVAILAGLGAGFPAQAGMNMEGLLEKLRDKGVLTEEEYQEMRQEARETRRAEALEKAQAKDEREAAKKNLVAREGFKFTDGKDWEIGLTGRINLDYRFNDDFGLAAAQANDRDSASIGDGFELRRARLGFAGYVWRDFKYNFLFNTVGNAPIADEFWVNYDANKSAQIMLGRFKQPFSLEQLTSSNAIDFSERSYNDQNGVPAKKLGAMLHGEPVKGFTYAGSVFQEGFNEITAEDGEGKRYAGRLTANFAELANIADTVLHVGVAGVGGDYQVRPSSSSQTEVAGSTTTRATIASFRTLNRGLANVYRAQIGGQLNGGADFAAPSEFGADVDSTLLGLEAALARGPLKVQGEYVNNDLDASNPLPGTGQTQQTARGDIKTYYVQALWNITGESWAGAYKGGKFGGLKPKQNFSSSGGWGAWQLALRYSEVDASDFSVAGTNSRIQSGRTTATAVGGVTNGSAAFNSKIDSYSIGLNWLLNPNARIMFEYTRTNLGGVTQPLDTASVAGSGSDKEDLFSIRSQINF